MNSCDFTQPAAEGGNIIPGSVDRPARPPQSHQGSSGVPARTLPSYNSYRKFYVQERNEDGPNDSGKCISAAAQAAIDPSAGAGSHTEEHSEPDLGQPSGRPRSSSCQYLWSRLSQSHSDLKQLGPHKEDKADHNWTVVAEKIAYIIKDLRTIRAQGYKGVIIKEDFWTQSLYAYVEGSAGFPGITRVWKAETESQQMGGKPTLSFEEWVREHREEIQRKLPHTPKIEYLEPATAKEYAARIEAGRFIFSDIKGIHPTGTSTGSTIHYTNGDWMERSPLPGGRGFANFVISKDKEFLLGSHSGGIFHHTSFQKGAVVIGAGALVIGHMPCKLIPDEHFIELGKGDESEKTLAGMLRLLNAEQLPDRPLKPIEDGELKIITSTSGHYKPDRDNLLDSLKVCREKGVDLARVITIEESPLGQSYFASAQEYLESYGKCPPYRCNEWYFLYDTDKKTARAVIARDEEPRATKKDLESFELLAMHQIPGSGANYLKLTSFGLLTYPLEIYLKSADPDTSVHPSAWSLGNLEHNGKHNITLVESPDYRPILKLLSFLKHGSTSEDYSQIQIRYERKLFASPDAFERCFSR